MEKIGIIDLGSNTARLVIAEMFADGHYMVVNELKESVRLGQDMDRDGFLKPQRIAETIKTLKMFKRLCDASGVERIIAVGTAAVRRAKNQRSFLDEIQVSCNITIRVLSEEEEALLVYRGVINSMDIPKGLILEIGGGSTKIIYYNRRNLLNYSFLPFGAVTLTDLFVSDPTPQEAAKHVEEFFTEQLKKLPWLSDIDPETQMIGVGGSFRNLFKISKLVRKYPLDTAHNYKMATEDFVGIYDMLKALDVDKRKKIKGLSPNRADIMPAAMAIVKSFVSYMNIQNFIIGGNGLGKSTLLKTLVGALPPLSGGFRFGAMCEIGYFDQQMAQITGSETVLDNFMSAFPHLNDFEARSALGAFLFSGEDVFKTINMLSGGERVRLALCKLFRTRPNVLILDEPTNHLDIQSKEILEEAIRNYTGTVLFVSHDRYFINSVSTRIIELKDKNLYTFIGNYDYYESHRDQIYASSLTNLSKNGSASVDNNNLSTSFQVTIGIH